MCEEYNGWTNRETWATALHINNDQGLYEAVQEMAKNTIEEFKGEPDEQDGTNSLGDAIEEMIGGLLDMEEVLSAPPAQRREIINMSRDIGSLYRVNWREISESFLSEIEVSA